MKKIKFIVVFSAMLIMGTSCNDWLEVLPENSQVSDTYWTSKEDVDAVLNSGYYYLREMVEDYLIPLGEIRAGCVYSIKSNNLQSFQVKPTDSKYCNWGPFYQIINIANTVLENAQTAQTNDDTYKVEELNSHYCEAYFLRALCYFYLVRNWREVPLITVAYADDSNTYKVAKSSEQSIIEQIKNDIKTALATGAAKEYFDTTWETKGRATKWALYALMADVCLWDEDYNTAVTYCDYLLAATSGKAPTFLSTPTHASWFSMYNPGNSNESIFELQWNYEEEQTNNLPVLFDNAATDRQYQLSTRLVQDLTTEQLYTSENLLESVRTLYGGYIVGADNTLWEVASTGYVWKYLGGQTLSDKRTKTYYDPNFIIYRVADVILMKAEGLILRNAGASPEDYEEAVNLVNLIRTRSNLEPMEYSDDLDEEDMLEMVLYERKVELLGEGKCWYDWLRFGRRNNNQYKSTFLIDNVISHNNQAGQSWLTTVLGNDDALFLPIMESELESNDLLVQNPYYE